MLSLLCWFPTFKHLFIFQDLSSGMGPAPFSHEDAAVMERESCDYSIKISLDEAKAGTGKFISLMSHSLS